MAESDDLELLEGDDELPEEIDDEDDVEPEEDSDDIEFDERLLDDDEDVGEVTEVELHEEVSDGEE
jgi:hypothetical protein